MKISLNFKYYFLSFLLANTVPGKSQNVNLPSDSLIKYSYTIFGQIGKTPVLDMGTCSFLEKNGELFLITAKHVLYHCDSLTKKESPKFELANIFLPANFEFIQIRVPELNDSCIIDYKDPDLFITKIDIKWLNKINTIEQFIIPPLKDYGKLTLFGQGMKNDPSYTGLDKQHNIQLKEKSFTFYSNCPVPDSSYIDTIHNFVETNQISVGRWMKGFSGSPVFLQDTKSQRWRFCGIFVQGLYGTSEKLPGGLILVNPDFILRTINSTFHKKLSN